MRVIRVLILSMIFLKSVLCYSNEKDANDAIENPDQLKSKEFWIRDAQRTLENKLKQLQNKNIAKNVIYFLGDGMSIPTVTASRIFDGELKGIVGERNQLSFEKFPYVGLSKTYCVDKQVSDSACTATAYLCGVKANYQTIGVTANVTHNDCSLANNAENQLNSIAGWALDAEKSAGIVTTTRITHASPAGTYARTSNRDFESDFNVKELGYDPAQCPDIAKQLVENEISKRFKVILGGGIKKFLANASMDDKGNRGERLDGRNLLNEWLQTKVGDAKVVQNRAQLLSVDTQSTDYLLGLFSPSHLAYHLDSDGTQPLLEEMTEVAIKMLQKNDNGYFLFIEGGRIDHAHHETRAKKALDETVQFSRAIERALKLTDSKDTLIVVTADHGHTMTISGYPDIANGITGLNTDISDIDNLPYSTLSYANGPAFENFYLAAKKHTVRRTDLRKFLDLGDKDFQYPAAVPLKDETHGGGDVAIYAHGPWSHLFSGVMEQNTVPALMGFASCIGPGLHSCNN